MGRLFVQQVEHRAIASKVELGEGRSRGIADLGRARVEQCNQPLKRIRYAAGAKLPDGCGLNACIWVIQHRQDQLVGSCTLEFCDSLAARSAGFGETILQEKCQELESSATI